MVLVIHAAEMDHMPFVIKDFHEEGIHCTCTLHYENTMARTVQVPLLYAEMLSALDTDCRDVRSVTTISPCEICKKDIASCTYPLRLKKSVNNQQRAAVCLTFP